MAAPPDEMRQQLADWFASVDPTMQQVLSTIYKEAPEAVSKAISGGAWEAAAGDPPLEEVLGGGSELAAMGLAISNYDVSPWPVTVGADVTISLGLTAYAPQPAFRTEFKITDPAGAETTQTKESEALEAGGEVTLTITLEAVVAGNYGIDIAANPDGAPQGQPANANGTQALYPNAGFVVESAESGANQQEFTALSNAMVSFMGLTSDPTWGNAATALPDGINWLASIESLEPDESTALASLGGRVGNYAADNPPNLENLRDLLTDIGVAASQSGSAGNDAEGRKPIIDALRALDGAMTAREEAA